MAAVSTIFDVITDRAVVTAVASATAVTGGAAITGRRLSASLVAFSAIVLTALTTDVRWSVYLDPPVAGRWWTIAIIVVPVAAVGIAAHRVEVSRTADDADLTILLAAAAAGVFLAVPETGLLRLVPGPMIIAAVATLAGLTLPFGRFSAVVLGTGLGWLAVIDGQTRPASIVGVAGCLAVVALSAMAPPSSRSPTRQNRQRWAGLASPKLAIGLVGIAACSRGAGVLESTLASAVIVVMVLAAVTTLIVGLTVPTRSTSPHPANPGGSS